MALIPSCCHRVCFQVGWILRKIKHDTIIVLVLARMTGILPPHLFTHTDDENSEEKILVLSSVILKSTFLPKEFFYFLLWIRI